MRAPTVPTPRRLAFAALLALLLVLPALAAAETVLRGPFSGYAVQKNASGCGESKQAVDATNSLLHAYAACGPGHVEGHALLGGAMAVKEGDTLTRYDWPVTVDARIVGVVSCTLGAEGRLTAELVRQRLVGSGREEEVRELRSWRCPMNGGTVSIDDPLVASVIMPFPAGYRYDVRLRLIAYAHADMGSAYASACGLASCPHGAQGQGGRLNTITLANAVPASRFDDQTYWFVEGLVYAQPPEVRPFIDATGMGCDYDYVVTSMTVRVDMGEAGPYERTVAGASTCLAGGVEYQVTAPGTYYGWANATDEHRDVGSDEGTIDMQIIPHKLGKTVVGFPNLANISASRITAPVVIDTRVTPEGEVRTYRVTSGNEVLMTNWGTVAPEPGDVVTKIEYDRALQFAWVSVEGVQEWAGGVFSTSVDDWWKIRPVGDTGPPESDATFTTEVTSSDTEQVK